MAWTHEDLHQLETALSSGLLEVRYGDKVVRYQSITEMLQLRRIMREQLFIAPVRTSFAAFRKE